MVCALDSAPTPSCGSAMIVRSASLTSRSCSQAGPVTHTPSGSGAHLTGPGVAAARPAWPPQAGRATAPGGVAAAGGGRPRCPPPAAAR